MRNLKLFITVIASFAFFYSYSQEDAPFTKADTLRGGNNANRSWWDVLKYQLNVEPDFNSKSIIGNCKITFKIIEEGKTMQIDLQDTLIIDNISFELVTTSSKKSNIIVKYKRVDGVYLVTIPKAKKNTIATLSIHYHGKPREALRPPWDGGWVFAKDSLGNPWMSVACQGFGASCWYPCKDIQSDEPDSGAIITLITPDSLEAISNGRIIDTKVEKHKKLTTWQVLNPINNYNIVPYIGKYTNFIDTLNGEGGVLNISYWVLNYNLRKAEMQFKQVKPMLHCFEYWFGKYPFYEDSYKLVEAPYLGMEHQSAVAYGNGYMNGYRAADLSSTGWGLKWDFIIVHESGHEWFGNNITTNDIADMWVHEGFTNYSETLYTEWLFGKEAGNDYSEGIRKRIFNDKPIIGPYGVNKEGSTDIYYKGSNLIHNIRHLINNDSLFREILRGLNKTFYHQTVNSKQIEAYISNKSEIDLSLVFNQYLRSTQIPKLVFKKEINQNIIEVYWQNCIQGFNMPITIPITNRKIQITTNQKVVKLSEEEFKWFNKKNLLRDYYLKIEEQ